VTRVAPRILFQLLWYPATTWDSSLPSFTENAKAPVLGDGARYAELLAAAGVPVELHNAETLIHGYLGYAGVVPAATEATERGLAALRTALT
jgi:hypothetical protein